MTDGPNSRGESATIEGANKEAVRRLFLDAGFARVGFTGAEPVDDGVSAWVAGGAHAGMDWLERDPGRRADPAGVTPGSRTVICVAAAYPAALPGAHVAAYACGEDYHRTLRASLEAAVAGLPAVVGHEPAARICVDTAPLLERAFAARAGLGWIGRNTMLLDEEHGPWMLLAEVLTDLDITPDGPAVDRCGSCTACVEACPTEALDGDHGLDARRCLSYWSIEHRGPLPEAWAAALGHRAFGCDDCLSACPFPRRPGAGDGSAQDETPGAAPEPQPDPTPFLPRPELAALDPDALRARALESFRRHFGSTPLERARKGGLLRNLDAVQGSGPSE
jgi:epoxyqueuosine reductase